MGSVKFKDFSFKVKDAMSDKILAVLEECAGELESQVKRNSRVKTGKTKNSFRHHVDGGTNTAYIGSNDENAIWEEFGTGEFALKGNGRRGGWTYVDEEGKGHFTYGKSPSRAFQSAYDSTKDKIKSHIQDCMKGL